MSIESATDHGTFGVRSEEGEKQQEYCNQSCNDCDDDRKDDL